MGEIRLATDRQLFIWLANCTLLDYGQSENDRAMADLNEIHKRQIAREILKRAA